ncbi:MAG: hypothetical protein EOO75_01845 [Myxococcales bacterium]|nr:MAG: hypothetical protein EOO75_01845 [Myxococcales bacterium]
MRLTVPYDREAILSSIEEADICLRSEPIDLLRAAHHLLTFVGDLLRPTFDAGPVTDIVSTPARQLVEMRVSHVFGRHVIDEAAGYLMVQFSVDPDHNARWTLQWWWDGGEHADHAAPTSVALTYLPTSKEFRGPDGHDAGVTLVRAITRKMIAERTREPATP